jgi:hypothetical protein
MSEIGKALVFYLTYFPEMQTLYEEEGTLPELENNEDGEAVSKRVKIIGRQASTDAADLLLKCVADLRSRLESSGVVTLKICKRDTIERNWQVSFDVFPARGKKPNGVTHQIGLIIERGGMRPWIWSRGGRAAEDRVRKLLSGVNCTGSKQLDWAGGSIGLNTIKIPWPEANNFHIEADPIIAETESLLKVMTPQFAAAFISRD